MSARNGAEFYAGFLSLFQEGEFQPGLVGFGQLAGQLVGTACYVVQEIGQFACLLVCRPAGNVEGVTGFQLPEYFPYLV